MAYTMEVDCLAIVPTSSAPFTAASLSSAAAVYASWICGKRVKLNRIGLMVSTLVAASVTAPAVAVYYRPTHGSTSGEVLLGTLTIPNGTAVGKVIYKDLQSISIPAGGEIVAKVSVQAVDGSAAAGAGFMVMEASFDPEVPGNESNMVASA